MKTITKKYIRKRKTTKKRTRKNGYLLKGGDKKEVEEETADKKEGEEGKPGEVIVDSEGNEWTFKNDSALGPIYYSVWTIRGEPVYLWTADKIAFFKGDFKKKAIKFFMDVFMQLNPTAIAMKTAMDTGISLLEENKDKIQNLKQMFTIPTPDVNISAPNMGAFSGANMVAAVRGGGKQKRRKFTKRRK